MKQFHAIILLPPILCSLLAPIVLGEDGYQNFNVAVYVRAQEVQQMKDHEWLAPRWDVLEKQVHVGKVYLETFRDQLVPDEEALAKAKQYFASKGIKTAGGIATVRSERNHFQSLCYTSRMTGANSRKSSNTPPGISTKSFWTISFSPVASANHALRQKATRAGPNFAWP